MAGFSPAALELARRDRHPMRPVGGGLSKRSSARRLAGATTPELGFADDLDPVRTS
jgi:hypothetical protein